MSLSRQEFDQILKLSKEFETAETVHLGPPPLRWERSLIAPLTKDTFRLHFWRGSIEIRKYTYNKTFRTAIVLGRFDSRGRHTNPDGTVFDGPHVHIYDEQYGDRIAYPISLLNLTDDAGMHDTFKAFLSYFNVAPTPDVQTSMLDMQ